MNIKLDASSLSSITNKLLQLLRKYGVFIFVLIVLGLFGFLIVRIRTLITAEPSQSAVDEKIVTIRPVYIDRSAVESIRQLEATNVEVQTLFQQARDNPFQE